MAMMCTSFENQCQNGDGGLYMESKSLWNLETALNNCALIKIKIKLVCEIVSDPAKYTRTILSDYQNHPAFFTD